jgi:XRE family transcriptional regulator, regulator of sulfur utilization
MKGEAPVKLKDRLAELRRERGITLRRLRDDIEERTGEKLSISYLSELERTDGVPSVETLARISAGYGMSLYDLLAPVDAPVNFSGRGSGAQYPKTLQALKEKGKLDEEWLETLSRIEYRGRRPRTEEEWLAIHAMLRAFIGRNG